MQIDYIEFSSPDIAATKAFFASAFGWSFNDYGPDYQEIADGGVSGGIAAAPLAPPLVILRSDNLEAALAQVTAAGATITRPIFAFPGGRRFHFREPGGTELAVWSGT
ncbi:VOC family protein [Paracoccus sp. (in: a-proteobacteria)]|uniref:VOC family protein n=1 Tax=Paracoccus sp. TaxID=267 RepID=UPI00321F83DE